jgi:hypothetical protein
MCAFPTHSMASPNRSNATKSPSPVPRPRRRNHQQVHSFEGRHERRNPIEPSSLRYTQAPARPRRGPRKLGATTWRAREEDEVDEEEAAAAGPPPPSPAEDTAPKQPPRPIRGRRRDDGAPAAQLLPAPIALAFSGWIDSSPLSDLSEGERDEQELAWEAPWMRGLCVSVALSMLLSLAKCCRIYRKPLTFALQ